MRIRILAALAIGIVLLGILPWGLVKPPADGVLALMSSSINVADLLICGSLAFVCGFLSSAICTPYGAVIGIISAPAGLAVWALRSAPVSKFFQMSPAIQNRLTIYSSLKLEGFIWLAIVICGLLGAMLADRIFRKNKVKLPDNIKPVFSFPQSANIAIAIIGTIFVANFIINIFATDVSYSDLKLGQVTAQPSNLQIAFAVFIGFGACGFLSKILLGSRIFWPAVATVILIIYSTTIYTRSGILNNLAALWPPIFFNKTIISILPVQMVSWGCLGTVWGYWLAVRYHLWRNSLTD